MRNKTNQNKKHQKNLPCCCYLVVAGRLVFLRDPEDHTGGDYTPSRYYKARWFTLIV